MNKGFTFIEIILGMAIFGFFAIGSLNLYSWVSKEGERTTYLTRRNIENEQMLEHLIQPIYFGLLASYPQNKVLNECLSADGVLCDVSKEYSLTAMDLNSGEPMSYVSGTSEDGIKNTLSFKVHCPLNQSSCDQPDYFVVKVKTEITKDNAPFTIEKTAMVAPQITNTATFTPDAAMSPGRNINIVLFLDNSNSLTYVKDKIKSALTGLTETIGNLKARVAIYNLYSGSNIAHQSVYYTLSGSTRTNLTIAEQIALPGNTTFYDEKTAQFYYRSAWTPTSTLYTMIDLDPDDDATLKSQKILALNKRIDTLFTEGQGTTWDTPFCQMMHLIDSPNPVIPINSEVPTVFILLTNEDEDTRLIGNLTGSTSYSSWKIDEDCYKSITAVYETKPPVYPYWGKKIFFSFKVLADFIADGAPATYEKIASVPLNIYDPTVIPGTDCTSRAAGFDKEIKSAILSYYPNSDIVFTGNYTVSSCDTQLLGQGLKQSSDPDLCTTYEAGFISSFPWYKPLSCWHSNPGSSSSLINWSATIPLIDWNSSTYLNQDTAKAVYETLQAKNVLKNIFYIPIIHSQSQSGSCPLTSGAAYGNKYESLANLLGSQAEMVSICNPDYTSKLKSITEGFISDLGLNDIEIPIEVAMALKSVEVTRGTTVLYPVKDQDYQLFNTTLIFTSGYLKTGDTVRVYTQ